MINRGALGTDKETVERSHIQVGAMIYNEEKEKKYLKKLIKKIDTQQYGTAQRYQKSNEFAQRVPTKIAF